MYTKLSLIFLQNSITRTFDIFVLFSYVYACLNQTSIRLQDVN